MLVNFYKAQHPVIKTIPCILIKGTGVEKYIPYMTESARDKALEQLKKEVDKLPERPKDDRPEFPNTNINLFI